MPIYEYRCQACGKKTELIQRMADPPLATCPQCGGEVKKLISSPAVQFKGTGWYVTDYKKGGAKPSEGGKAEGGKAESGGEAKAAEKPASAETASGGSTETKAAKAAGSD